MAKAKKRDPNKDRARMVYQILYILFIALFIALLFIDWIWLSHGGIRIGKGRVSVGLLIFVLQFLYALASASSVEPGMIAALIFLKKPIFNFRSGIIFVPLGLATVRTETRNIIQIEIGTPITNEKNEVIQVSVPDRDHRVFVYDEPFRVTFADPETASYDPDDETDKKLQNPQIGSLVPTHRAQLTSDPHLTCQFQIKDLCLFIEEVGSLAQAGFLMDRTLRSAAQREFRNHTPAQALRNLPEVCRKLTRQVELLIGENVEGKEEVDVKEVSDEEAWWGIDVRSVEVPVLGLPKRLNVAMANNAMQGARSLRIINASRAEQQKLENVGAGRAKAHELFQLAEVHAVAELAKTTGTEAGLAAAQIRAAETAASNAEQLIMAPPSTINVLANGFGNLLGKIDTKRVPEKPKEEPKKEGE